MKAFFIALIFGVAQAFLLKNLLFSITAGNTKKAVLIFILKFALYGVGVSLVMLAAIRSITYCFCGFAVGMPVTAIALFVYLTYFKNR